MEHHIIYLRDSFDQPREMREMLNITKTGYTLSCMKHNKHANVIINVSPRIRLEFCMTALNNQR